MKFIYKRNEIIGETLTKYNIVFVADKEVEVLDNDLIQKLEKSPYLTIFFEQEVEEIVEEKPKRKYTKKKKVKEDEAQIKAETETEAEIEEDNASD